MFTLFPLLLRPVSFFFSKLQTEGCTLGFLSILSIAWGNGRARRKGRLNWLHSHCWIFLFIWNFVKCPVLDSLLTLGVERYMIPEELITLGLGVQSPICCLSPESSLLLYFINMDACSFYLYTEEALLVKTLNICAFAVEVWFRRWRQNYVPACQQCHIREHVSCQWFVSPPLTFSSFPKSSSESFLSPCLNC